MIEKTLISVAIPMFFIAGFFIMGLVDYIALKIKHNTKQRKVVKK